MSWSINGSKCAVTRNHLCPAENEPQLMGWCLVIVDLNGVFEYLDLTRLHKNTKYQRVHINTYVGVSRYIYILKYVFIFIYMCVCIEKRLKGYIKLMSTYFAETVWIRRWGELKGSLIFYFIYYCITSFFGGFFLATGIYSSIILTDVKINKQISL